MNRILAPVLFCALLSAPLNAANVPFVSDEDELDTGTALRDSGPREMTDDDIEDMRAAVNGGRDPDDFEVPRAPEATEESPEKKITSPAVWKDVQAKAQQGDAEAFYILGMCYTMGHPLPRDLEKAYKFFFTAARKNHKPAMFFAARCLEMEIGIKTPEDREAAFKTIIPQYYGFAAAAGSADAAYHLGRFLKYTSGSYGERAIQQSVARHFREATEKGHAAAQYELALSYRNGEGLPKLRKLSFKILRVSAEQGYGKAQFDLGLRYAAGDFRVPQDRVEAYAWIATAIFNGIADDTWALANLKNQLTAADLEIAKKRAAEYIANYKAESVANPLL